MNASRTETIAPPPGVVGSLRAGFDTIASHLTAILLPLFLDLLLWLGPRLSLEALVQPGLAQIQRLSQGGGASAAEAAKQFEFYRTLAHELNLLSALRSFPIGISSLMVGVSPDATPFGEPLVFQVGSIVGLFAWIVLLTIAGWVGGAVYFRRVAALVDPAAAQGSVRNGGPVLQSMGLSALSLVVLFAIGAPLMMFVIVLARINMILAQAVVLFLGILSMWILVPVFFSPMGIFMRRQNLFGSILTGVQLARFTLPSSSLFVLSVLLIAVGLNIMWRIPPAESWMSLVGILGHAFVTTALLAASFIYYRDMTVWLQNILERIKAGTAAPQT